MQFGTFRPPGFNPIQFRWDSFVFLASFTFINVLQPSGGVVPVTPPVNPEPVNLELPCQSRWGMPALSKIYWQFFLL